MGNGLSLKIAKVGTIKLKKYNDTIRTFRGIRHVKDLKKNLLLVGQLDDLGCKIHVESGILKMVRGNLVVMKVEKIKANLYVLMGDILQDVNAMVASTSQEEAIVTWHHRLGICQSEICKPLQNTISYLGLKRLIYLFYEHCVINKQHRLKFTRVTTKSKHILDLIHSDVWEPLKLSLKGEKYFVSFIDDYFKRLWVYPMKKKSYLFDRFQEFKAQVELEIGKRIKCLRTDNKGEYIDGNFLAFCKQEGIIRQYFVPQTPHKNGVAEQMNKTLLKRIRTMLQIRGVTKSLWTEVVKTAYYLIKSHC